MPILDYASILHDAQQFRHRSGLVGERPPHSTHRLIEACFGDVLVTGADLPRGVIECAIDDGERTVLYSRHVNTPAQRVGIVHGLAHLQYDIGQKKRCLLDYRSTRARSPAAERRADVFAGEILVPLVELDAHLPGPLFPTDANERHMWNDRLDEVASLFAVPTGFVRWRCWDLLRIRQSNMSL